MFDYIDKKYIDSISTRVQGFEWRSNEAIMRCPICGDSKKNKLKKRGYIFEMPDGSSMYKCHNCSTSMPLGQFIKFVDPSLYKTYQFDKFSQNSQGKRKYQQEQNFVSIEKDSDFHVIEKKKSPIKEKKKMPLDTLKSVYSLEDSHPAKIYCLERKIPEENMKDLFYTDNYKFWLREKVDKTKFLKTTEENLDPRIIIPLRTKSGLPFAYQGRYIGDKKDEMRYISCKDRSVLSNSVLVYGLDRVDLSKRIYIMEGPFDSMFVDNAIAVAGSSLKKMDKFLVGYDIVFIFDNEPRSKEIIKLMDDVILLGSKILIWPDDIKEKDVNQMVQSNIDIQKILDTCIYQGLEARLRFSKWKKLKTKNNML